MNIIDIILLVIAAWAVYEGIRDGLLVQVGEPEPVRRVAESASCVSFSFEWFCHLPSKP